MAHGTGNPVQRSLALLGTAVVFVLLSATASAQLSGTYTIPSGLYPTIQSAIAAINSSGVGFGGVTFDVTAGHTETLANPRAGYLRDSTASSTNPIIFQKSGSGANPKITAARGYKTTGDAIIALIGTDYVTFDGIDLSDAATNTDNAARAEYGYAFGRNSNVNACIGITIKNCVITLNKANTASYGIVGLNSDTTLATATTKWAIPGIDGRHADHQIYSNTIQNVYNGIYYYGHAGTSTHYDQYDYNLRIGTLGGNTIQNFGGQATTGYGIYLIYQDSARIENNTVNSMFASNTTFYGIFTSTGVNSFLDITGNTVTVKDSSTTTSTLYGISTAMGGSGTSNTVNITDNVITNCAYPGTSGIFYALSSTGAAFTLNVTGNNVVNNTVGSASTTGTGSFYGLYSSASNSTAGSIHTIAGNTIRGNQRIQSALGTGTHYVFYVAGAGETAEIFDNVIGANTFSSTSTSYVYYLTASSVNKNFYRNSVDSLTMSGGTIYTLYNSNGTNVKLYGNSLAGISAGGSSATVYGVYATSGTTVNIFNNFISNLQTPASSSNPAIYGIWTGSTPTTVRLLHNTVFLNASSSSGSFGAAGLYISTTPSTQVRNNIVVNKSTPGATGRVVAFQRSSASTAQPSDSSDGNLYYAGTPGTTRLIHYDATNSDQTIQAYKARMAALTPPREDSTVTEDVPFVNVGAPPYDLHIDPVVATRVESGGVNSTTFEHVDYDGNDRFGNPVYAGLGTAPDIGADEGDFTQYICSGAPYAGSAVVIPILACGSDTTGIYADGVAMDPGISYQWQESDDNGVTDPWANAVGGANATTTWYTTPAYTAARWYRLKVTCGPSATDSYTNAVLIRAGLNGHAYTINQSAAATDLNHTSFAELNERLRLFGMCGPSTVTLATGSGPYNEQVRVDSIWKSNPYDLLVINGNGESVTTTPSASNFVIFDINRIDYFKVKKLTVQGLSNTYGIGFAIRNRANKITIDSCTVNLSAVTSTTSSNSSGIAFTSSLTAAASGADNGDSCTISNNSITGGTAGGPYWGISMYGALNATLDYNDVSNNTVNDFYTNGIYGTYTNGTNISGNIVQRTSRSTVSTFYGVYLSTGAKADVIQKNRVRRPFDGNPSSTSAAYGIGIASVSAGLGTEITVKNNLVYDFYGSGTQYGLYASAAPATRFYHNTVSLEDLGAVTTNTTYGYYQSSTSTPAVEFLNNNVTVRRAGTGTKYGIYLAGADTLISNYNNLFVNAASGTNTVGARNAVSYNTLVLWQGLINGYDINSVSVDPSYENAANGNFKPQTAALDNAGTNLSSAGCSCVTDDILGTSRSSTPDLGAYEFTASSMTVSSVAATQSLISSVPAGARNARILGIEITAVGAVSPISLTDLRLTTTGTTSASDIDSAQVFYTGTSSVFDSTNQFGAGIANPSGAFTLSGSQALVPGTNYFWLVYDVNSGASACNVLDATLDSAIAGGTGYASSPSSPSGARYIKSALSGTYTVSNVGTPSCTTYLSIADAFADLTTLGVAGPVTFNVAAGHTETGINMLLSTTTSNATNTITFQKSGSGANPLITAGTGVGGEDGVIEIEGTDYVTFDGIDVQESSSNLNATTQAEYAYSTLKRSTTDGARYVTVRNATLTLNKANSGTAAVYQNNHTAADPTLLTITDTAGSSSYNRFYNLTISNTNMGFYVYGASDSVYYDHGTEIGVAGGNTVSNFGGGTNTGYGMYIAYQDNLKVANNTVNGLFGHLGSAYGLYLTTALNANFDVYNNYVSINDSAASSTLYGIGITMGSSGTSNTANVYNNRVENCSYPTSTSGVFYGMYNSSSQYRLNMYGNTVANNTLGSGAVTSTGAMYGIYSSASNTAVGSQHDIYNNTVRGNSRVQSTAGSGTNYFFYIPGAGETLNLYNNVVGNNNGFGTGSTYGMYVSASSLTKNIYGNTIDTLSAAGGSVYGMYLTSGTTVNLSRNTIGGVSATASAGLAYGVYVSSGTTVNLVNNLVSNITAPTGSGNPSIYGVYISGPTTQRMYHNSIYLDGSSTSPSFGATGLYASTTPTVDLRGNIIVNNSTPGTTGRVVAYQRSSTTISSMLDSSNTNCLYAGTPSTQRLLFYDGTNTDQTLTQYKARVTPRDAAAVTELPPFINTTTAPYNLHLSTSTATQCEGSGARITTVALDNDYDGNTRYGATGYAGASVTGTDIGADEGDFTMLDIVAPSIAYSALPTGIVAATRAFQNVTITDISGVNGTSGTRPRVYYKKGRLYNEWNDNTSATEGWKWVEANGGTSPFDFTIDYAKLPGGSIANGDTVWYFVTAQDIATTPNVGIFRGTFAAAPSSVALTNTAFPIGDTANVYKYTIAGTLSGTVTVPGTYPSLTGAGGLFEAVNGSVLSGDLFVSITDSTYEDGTYGLNAVATNPPNSPFTIRIEPSGASLRTIRGITTSGMIRFNGADRVTFDGRYNGSGRYLRLLNIGTTAPTVQFDNDASNDTLRYMIVEGNYTTSTGGIIRFNAGTTTGHDDNVITQSWLRARSDSASLPGSCIYGTGAANITHDNLKITDNEFSNFYNYGIYASTNGLGNNLSISGNSFFNDGSVVIASTHYLIYLSVGTPVGYTITNNFFGGSAPNCGGAAYVVGGTGTFYGTYLNTGSTLTNVFSGNTYQNFSFTGASGSSYWIYIASGKAQVGVSSGNLIGDGTVASSIMSTRAGTTYLMYLTSSDSLWVYNNTVANLTYTGTASAAMAGMYRTAGVSDIRGNMIHDISNDFASTTTTTTSALIGLSHTSTGTGHVIRDNQIYNLSNTGGGGSGVTATAVQGIVIGGSGSTGTLSNNKVYGLVNSSGATSGALLNGIRSYFGNWTFANNYVSITNAASSTDPTIVGIYDDNGAGPVKYLHNSVYIGGSSAGSVGASSAFARTAATPVTIVNNLLYNGRSGGSGNIAISTGTGAATWVSDYNLYVVPDTSKVGIVGATPYGFHLFKLNNGSDLSSYATSTSAVAATSLFVSPSTGNLKVDSTNAVCWAVNGKGVAGSLASSIADDFTAMGVRSTTAGTATDIGADEFTTSTTPPSAVQVGGIVADDSTLFYDYGRLVGKIYWYPGYTGLPSSLDFKFYTGVAPSGVTQGNYGSAYWSITETGGSGYMYDLTLYYAPNMLGSVPYESNITMGKRDGTNPWASYPTSIVDTANNTVKHGGFITFSEFTIADVASPLPVELAAFTARLLGNTVRLDWSTTSELNAFRYAVERRTNAGWEEIGSVNARGSVDTPTSYSFIDDRLPKSGDIVYRLRMIDRDGTVEYSNEVRVALGTPDGFRLFANYPNPFNPGTTISFALPTEEHVTVRVHDASGRLVETLQNGVLPSGTHSVTFFARELPSGVYIYTVTAGASTKSGTMILAR